MNYEARTQTDPPDKKAKRKLKNYKLKHSRLLTCYSGLAHLLAVFAARRTVTPSDVEEMVRLSPTERIQGLPDQPASQGVRPYVDEIVDLYERFLAETDAPEDKLVEKFLDRDRSRQCFREANRLGEKMYHLLVEIGGETELHRLLVV